MFDDIFEEARQTRAFPGGVVWLGCGGAAWTHRGFGATAYEAPLSRPVSAETIYDLASVSKLYTLAAFLAVRQESGIDVEAPLSRLLPAFDTPDKRAITLRQLMNHTTGLGFAVQRLEKELPETWIEAVAGAPLAHAPGTRVLYSCTNYFLLARAVETLSGHSLDRVLQERLFAPLGLARTTFRPLDSFAADEIAPAETNARGHTWHGVVHDEAARAWQQGTGGACGNAGVFAAAADVARFIRLWLDDEDGPGAVDGRQVLPPDDVRRAFADTVFESGEDEVDEGESDAKAETKVEAAAVERTRRGWGWLLDVPSFMGGRDEGRPLGTAGHSGFTGPTVFFHPRSGHIGVVLENRVHPTRHGPERMPFHKRIAARFWQQQG